MDNKTLRTLEFLKVKEILKGKAQSSLGKERVEELVPSTSIDEIERLQEETKEAYEILVKKGNPPLFGIYSIKQEIKRVEIGGSLTPAGLLKVSDILRVARALKNFMKEKEEEIENSSPIIEALIEELRVFKNIEESINRAIISDTEISDDASSTLRTIRRQMKLKNEDIKRKLEGIIGSQAYKKYLQDSIVTIREGRYVIPVKQENRSQIKGIVHDMSSSGATVFIEPMAIVELNNDIRDLELKEREEIEKILEELSNLVATAGDEILNNQEILTEIDFIFAKGRYAFELNGSKPSLNKDGILNFKKARHPLIDKNVVVPTDVYLGKDFNSLIITGPNTGGKTVTIKTVGLLTLMAQAGLHIPADLGSEVAVFDQVFADIGDEQSIEQSLSTFSSHMTNIVSILENISENSLVLFDELGAGTDPTEGAALAMSILDNLLNRNIRTIATTHYSQLKVYALTTEGVKNASVEFSVETLSPTYRLLIGVPGKSNAFEISRRLGLQDYIIDYAKELISKENVEFEDVLQALDKDRRETEENLSVSERERREVERLREELKLEKSKLKNAKDDMLQKAREEAKNILKDAKLEADTLVKDIKDLSYEIEKDRELKLRQAQEKIKQSLGDIEAEISDDIFNAKSNKVPDNLKAGETVEVITFGQKGEVLEAPDENGNVLVQIGIMKVNTHITTLKRSKSEEVERIQTKTKNIIKRKSQNVKSEIDLRGLNLDEAFLEVDKYLDDAYIAGLDEVQIIHGKGTGVLRDGIKTYLRTHKHVKSSRLGEYGEGGDGVTVVTLK